MGQDCPVATSACARPLALEVVTEFYRHRGAASKHFAVPLGDDQLVIGKPNALFSAGMYVLVTRGPDAGQVVWNNAWEEPPVARNLVELLYQMWLDRSRDVRAEPAAGLWAVRHDLESDEVEDYLDALRRGGLEAVLRGPSFWLLERDGTFAKGSYARGARSWECSVWSEEREPLLAAWRAVLGANLSGLRERSEGDVFSAGQPADASS
jgi:hypothetical protein